MKAILPREVPAGLLARQARNACETVWELQLLLACRGVPFALVHALLRPLLWAFTAVFGRRTVAEWWAGWALTALGMLNRGQSAVPGRSHLPPPVKRM